MTTPTTDECIDWFKWNTEENRSAMGPVSLRIKEAVVAHLEAGKEMAKALKEISVETDRGLGGDLRERNREKAKKALLPWIKAGGQ